jgi:hypothetical protein
LKDNCWKFPKFHELLRVVDNIESFGAPRNYHAERPEAPLIDAAKDLGVVLKNNMKIYCMSYNLQSESRSLFSLR